MTREVRVLEPDDWELWREIRLRSLADSPGAFGSTLAREQGFAEADWRTRLESVSVLVLDGGRPVALGGGYRVRDGWLQVVAMWVEPDQRGRGLSRLVLDAVVEAARAEGRRVVLGVTRGNGVARTAYERYGFVATGESEPLREGSELVVDEMVLPEMTDK